MLGQLTDQVDAVQALGPYGYLLVTMTLAFGGTLVYVARWFRALDEQRVDALARLEERLAKANEALVRALRQKEDRSDEK